MELLHVVSALSFYFLKRGRVTIAKELHSHVGFLSNSTYQIILKQVLTSPKTDVLTF